MDKFKASVQYGDWQGTAAADDDDGETLSKYLEATGLLTENQCLIASSVWVGENRDGRLAECALQPTSLTSQNMQP